MKTNQLPPELVEKMVDSVINGFVLEKTSYRIGEKCAQIAVEYADELVKSKDHELSVERYKTSVMNEAYEKAKQQRDELLEALREIIRLKDESQISWMMSNIEESKKLINKIDGK